MKERFRAQALKVRTAHCVFDLVLAGITPFTGELIGSAKRSLDWFVESFNGAGKVAALLVDSFLRFGGFSATSV